MMYPFLGRDYQLEKQGDEGNFVDMEATLESTGVPFVFNLVRESGSNHDLIDYYHYHFFCCWGFHCHLYI